MCNVVMVIRKRLGIILGLVLVSASCNEDDGVNGKCIEEKKDSCVVTFELNPVCGCNGTTYENPSKAECSGIDDYTIGACN